MFTFTNCQKRFTICYLKRFSKLSYMYFLCFLPSSLLTNSHILRSVRWPATETCTVTHARDHWLTLDFANAFVSPGVNSRAELVPSPRAYAQNGVPRRWFGEMLSITPWQMCAISPLATVVQNTFSFRTSLSAMWSLYIAGPALYAFLILEQLSELFSP